MAQARAIRIAVRNNVPGMPSSHADPQPAPVQTALQHIHAHGSAPSLGWSNNEVRLRSAKAVLEAAASAGQSRLPSALQHIHAHDTAPSLGWGCDEVHRRNAQAILGAAAGHRPQQLPAAHSRFATYRVGGGPVASATHQPGSPEAALRSATSLTRGDAQSVARLDAVRGLGARAVPS